MGDRTINLVVDCDPGLDDALALAVLSAARRRGDVALHGIIAAAGNVGLAQTIANAAYLAERFALDTSVIAGAGAPLVGTIRGDAAEVHGSDGLGGLRPGPPSPAVPSDLDAAGRLLGRLAAMGGTSVVLATGPLTDLAHVIRARPTALASLDRVVVMGGGFGAPRGNVTSHAEFNAWADPVAFSEVAASGVPIEIVPLDVTTRVTLTRDDSAAIDAAVGGPSVVSRIIDAGIALSERLGRGPVFEMHDPLAAAAVLDPTLLEWHDGTVEVQTEGPGAGRTDLLRTGDRHRVALDVDVGRSRRVLVDLLVEAARVGAAVVETAT